MTSKFLRLNFFYLEATETKKGIKKGINKNKKGSQITSESL